MRNVCQILVVFMFITPAWGEETRQPDSKARLPRCQHDLNPQAPKPGYANSFEEDRRRQEPGPDEVEDRNPEEFDAHDPGGF